MDPSQDVDASRALPQAQEQEVLNAFISRMRAHAASELEKEYPWMAKVAVKEISDKVASALEKRVTVQLPVMSAAKSRTGFLELPRELRNFIYELVLNDHSDDGQGRVVVQSTIMARSDEDDDLEELAIAGAFAGRPNLLETSPEVQAEAEPFFYGSSTFVVEVSEDTDAEEAQGWLKEVGPRCRPMIRHLVVNLMHLDRAGFIELLFGAASCYKGIKCLRLHNQLWTDNELTAPLHIPMLQQLRTCQSLIKKKIRLDTVGVPESALTINIRSGTGEPASLSPTELFCGFCYETGEPDTAAFAGGVCVGCEFSREEEGGLRVGPWTTKRDWLR